MNKINNSTFRNVFSNTFEAAGKQYTCIVLPIFTKVYIFSRPLYIEKWLVSIYRHSRVRGTRHTQPIYYLPFWVHCMRLSVIISIYVNTRWPFNSIGHFLQTNKSSNTLRLIAEGPVLMENLLYRLTILRAGRKTIKQIEFVWAASLPRPYIDNVYIPRSLSPLLSCGATWTTCWKGARWPDAVKLNAPYVWICSVLLASSMRKSESLMVFGSPQRASANRGRRGGATGIKGCAMEIDCNVPFN